MESPQNQIWGPNLWIILHSLAQKFGKTTKNLTEEKRLWTGLLSSLRWSLPCPHCKKHYSLYYIANPLSTDIRIWLHTLHNQINMRNEKQPVTIDQLEQYNVPFHFSYHYSFVYEQMILSLRIGWSSHNDIQRTIRFFNEMKCFYDLF